MIDGSLNNTESLALNSTISCHSSTGNKKNLCRWTVIENIAEKEALKTSGLSPLTPRSDKHVTSPHYIHTSFSKQVLRILKLITKVANTKFL